ncbi:zinc finger MYM-type protein 6 [Trichonephila clavata]|uniref:Zinc finger MYM-type protein 6 n=1 Tax=Trichonephila clavata TaxID=2740835 RepID=A0A8X6HWX3_TRICU|nr:zinc finger MYM-type protein 6 [Trichonephila clavata]
MSQKNDNKTGIVPGKKRKPFIRHYNHEYIKYGFILWPNSTEEDIRPMCIICHEVLVNDAMKPAKMLRHLKAKHSELEKKPREYFERRKQELGLQTKTFKQNFIHNKSLLKCSYLVALRIAKTRKSFTTGENLIKPVLIDVCLEMFGLSAVDKIKSIPLSNDTIRRRIEKLSENVEYQLIQKIKESTLFAIQIDESCDISKKAILICYRLKEVEDRILYLEGTSPEFFISPSASDELPPRKKQNTSEKDKFANWSIDDVQRRIDFLTESLKSKYPAVKNF